VGKALDADSIELTRSAFMQGAGRFKRKKKKKRKKEKNKRKTPIQKSAIL